MTWLKKIIEIVKEICERPSDCDNCKPKVYFRWLYLEFIRDKLPNVMFELQNKYYGGCESKFEDMIKNYHKISLDLDNYKMQLDKMKEEKESQDNIIKSLESRLKEELDIKEQFLHLNIKLREVEEKKEELSIENNKMRKELVECEQLIKCLEFLKNKFS